MGALQLAAVPHSETAGGRKSAFKRGLAIAPASPGGAPGFPVTDPEHWEKARQAIGRVKSPARRAAVARLLRKTAPRFGKTAALKGSWAAPGGSKHTADAPGGVDLVGPKGYVHDWRFVGVPSPGSHIATRRGGGGHRRGDLGGYEHTTARRLRAGDKIAYGSKGTLEQHTVISAQHHHTATGQDRTALHLRRPDGSTHRISISSASVVNRNMSFAAPAGPALEFAMRMPVMVPVSSPFDLVITRGDDGSAMVRHRRGGGEIARIRRTDDGKWVAAIEGQDLQPHARQRGALLEAIGTHNRASGTPQHRPSPVTAPPPLQPPPVQTPLMAAYGIPAIRALATPAVSASGGPRATGYANGNGKNGDGDGDGTDDNGLNPRGQAIYKKLKARGFPDARAVAFAKRAQSKMSGDQVPSG
jgi:hypothetical protein